jgi:NAD-dependent DNA ligase
VELLSAFVRRQARRQRQALNRKNDKYAVKYVFSESEFIDHFRLRASEGQAQPKYSFRMERKLDRIALQLVYTNAPVAPSARAFIEGKN